MNILRKISKFSLNGQNLPICRLIKIPKRKFCLKNRLQTEQEISLDENLYWDNLQSSLDESSKAIYPNSSKLLKAEKNVFVLQLKMQYKSKARQSTSADLQLAESISLVETLDNWKVIESHIVGTKKSSSREIFGSGNQDLLSKKISSSGADTLFIVIDRLTNLQVNGLRQTLLGNNPNIAIYDRYKIVLEIFKRNARSSIAKLQIALAEIPYLRHKFENNELFKNVEKRIRKELDFKLKTRSLLNTQRREKQIPLVSVFGYTNVGKTTFIKSITNDEKLKPKNQLFATLDITYHGASLCNSNQDIIFADTIGFINDIPHNLIEAFKTSLSDALNADLFIHLVDSSHPDREAQEKSVNKILLDLAPEEKMKDMLTVYNKIDKVKHFPKSSDTERIMISCKKGDGLIELRNLIEKKILKKLGYLEITLRVAQGSEEFSYLYKNSIVKEVSECDQDSNFVNLKVLFNKSNALKFIKIYPNVKISK
ncbi:unnamed protein product [Brachionus calyciflorus]|uniref:Hflx-type G domain-containing protein n=1 Tax=Brachionus calyciflorus TaxID=104777 RepID=A0A813RNQ4_9BILA|nr:unnamed protein product [Brachionus calyciflorus]